VAPGLTVNDASGFLLGAVLWVLVLQYVQGGLPAVRRWLRAKFVNKGPDGSYLP
jgi:hypothetical protein